MVFSATTRRRTIAAATALSLVFATTTVVPTPAAQAATQRPCLRVPGLPPALMPLYMGLFYVDLLLSLVATAVSHSTGGATPQPGSSGVRCA
ncbi:hypothetical protein ACFSSC_03855 [Corynebacterium mendelii]|uniref:Uncharacterized protein n=1 Tax=Corynebacterium mendelii TaxID=2765362 RepID=A0A939IUQ8_9CORY|nr:hypothetical protein [Corynebacterium mendelii]MBN9643461.1 hypothetical protein [Corynebacterium mendelii]